MVTSEAVQFESGGVTLRGVLRRPEGLGPFPAIVLTHGLAFVMAFFDEHNFPRYFAEAGFITLVYDHPNTGRSGGLPRQELDPVAQQRAYSDAITLLTIRPDVDPQRIGIWGTSYSGGHVLAVSAADPRVRCVVAQTPTINGRRNLTRRLSEAELRTQQQSWALDRTNRAQGRPPQTVQSGSPAAAKFVASLAEESQRGYLPYITQRSQEWYYAYDPGASIKNIHTAPLLMIVAENDKVTPSSDSREAFASITGPKQLLLLPRGHFDVYGSNYQRCAKVAAIWFRSVLVETSAPGPERR